MSIELLPVCGWMMKHVHAPPSSFPLTARYTIRTNGTVFKDASRGDRFDGTKFTERWDNVRPNAYWRNYWAFMNVQNAFDAAIISFRVRKPLRHAVVSVEL